MSEDPLLRELGQIANEEKERTQARFDERWDRLAAGTLNAEEEAELRALAEASPEAREAYEAFRPLGEDFQRRLAARLASEIEHGARREEPHARLLWFSRWRRTASWASAAAAAAAALFLLLHEPGPGRLPPVPTYLAEVSGGTRTFRGEEAPSTGPPVFEPGDRFQIVLRPGTKIAGEGLEARCFLLRDGDPRRPEARVRVDPGGAVKIEGSIGRDLQPGGWTLWTVVGREGELPDPADPRFRTARAEVRSRDWVALPNEIRIRSRSP
jgi:hypothetical protein